MTEKKENWGKRDLARLLDYYRLRVEGFEKERVEWMERLEGLRLSQEEHHRLEWELRRRTEEIIELQNALCENQVALNGERKQIINLTEELENSKLRTKEDRRRLTQLLQLAEPVEQTIKLFYDRRPEKLEKYPGAGGVASYKSEYCNDPQNISLTKSLRKTGSKTKSIGKPTRNKIQNIQNVFHFGDVRIAPSDEKQHIVRTIMLPNQEEETAMKNENEFLKSQLSNLKLHYESQIFKMEEDRRLREEEIRLRDIHNKEKIEDLVKKNQKLEKINYELTKDHMQLKYDCSNSEKRLYEELEVVKLQNEALEVSLKELMYRSNTDKETTKTDYERKTREITNVMRNQVKSQEENNNIIKEQYKQIQKIYTTRVKELEDKLKSLTEKLKNSENKRNFELEGYINEIQMMRKRLKSYEDYVNKVRRYMTSQEMQEETKKFEGEVQRTKVSLK
jgi:coiled-coil domain-containing protein 77